MPGGAFSVGNGPHRSSAAGCISRTKGKQVAAEVVSGVRRVLTLNDRTEGRGVNAHTTGEAIDTEA